MAEIGAMRGVLHRALVVALVAAAVATSSTQAVAATAAAAAAADIAAAPPPAIHCDAGPGKCIRLWPGTAPNETAGFPGPETRRGDDGQGCGPDRDAPCDHIYNVSVPTLTPFLVTNGTRAAVIIAPGGGYHDLAWGKEGIDTAKMYNSIGVSAFVLKYRVPARPDIEGLPKWWAPLQDAQRAIGLVRASAKSYGLDADKIGFTGFSAGGHLAAHISTAWRQRIYPSVDPADKTPCNPNFTLFMYPWFLLPNNKPAKWGEPYALADEFSGDAIQKDHPVSFFCQNEDDPTAPVQGALTYHSKLLSVGAPMSSLHIYPKGGHGFGLCQSFSSFQEVCDWPAAARRFLQDHGFAPGWP